MPIGRRAKPSARFKLDQACKVRIEGETFYCRPVKFLSDDRIKIRFQGGGFSKVTADQLEISKCITPGCGRDAGRVLNCCDVCMGLNKPVDAESEAEDDPATRGGKEMRFVQYKIRWEQPKKEGKKPRRFRVHDVDNELEYYGWWRKTKNRNDDRIFYAIDIFAKKGGHHYTLESLFYETNPLKDMRSLEADICAALNKFLHQTVNGHAESIDLLQAKARFPVLRVTRLATIDRIITELTNTRATSCRAGGERLVEIRGDNPDSPTVRVFFNLTTQAMGLQGRVPSIHVGSMYDNPQEKGVRHGKKQVVVPNSKNVEDLVSELAKAKKAGDASTARKIRAVLRKMGHKGGARSLKKKEKK